MAAPRRRGKRVHETEQRLLDQAVQEAARWLSEGKFSAGYRCLLAGLERAREWEASGEPWAKELVAAWRTALFEYSALYPTTQRTAASPRPQTIPQKQDVFLREKRV
jgi:hypothetical protein